MPVLWSGNLFPYPWLLMPGDELLNVRLVSLTVLLPQSRQHATLGSGIHPAEGGGRQDQTRQRLDLAPGETATSPLCPVHDHNRLQGLIAWAGQRLGAPLCCSIRSRIPQI